MLKHPAKQRRRVNTTKKNLHVPIKGKNLINVISNPDPTNYLWILYHETKRSRCWHHLSACIGKWASLHLPVLLKLHWKVQDELTWIICRVQFLLFMVLLKEMDKSRKSHSSFHNILGWYPTCSAELEQQQQQNAGMFCWILDLCSLLYFVLFCFALLFCSSMQYGICYGLDGTSLSSAYILKLAF